VRPSRGLAALFLAALLGVVVVLAIAAHAVAGVPGLVALLVVVAAVLVGGGLRLRRLSAGAAAPVQHCTCCDGDHAAPVRVV
jgi:hypothetical protein